jgi:hypothetical protein
MQATRYFRNTELMLSQASQLPQGSALNQDFLACWYSGITFGIAALNEAIRLSEAG